ncbi:MAG TPA: hypothetical protein PK748_13855, partial [Acidimicrobiales bacterium]|nr:hypothetical protein [Acidimicrobiales bacterium]
MLSHVVTLRNNMKKHKKSQRCRLGRAVTHRRGNVVALKELERVLVTERAVPDLFDPYRLGPLTLRNRIVKAATFEGVMPNGSVSDDLIAFHRRVAAGGAALTTVAYCAVAEGGRVHRHTLVMRPEITPDLQRLTDAVHDEGALVSAQIGHAGLVANTRSNR